MMHPRVQRTHARVLKSVMLHEVAGGWGFTIAAASPPYPPVVYPTRAEVVEAARAAAFDTAQKILLDASINARDTLIARFEAAKKQRAKAEKRYRELKKLVTDQNCR